MTRLLRDADVRGLVRFPEAVRVVGEGVIAAGESEETAAGRLVLKLPDGWLRVMAGSVPSKRVVGFKAFHLAPDGGVHYLCALDRLDTGEPLALLDANYITLARTAAAAAAAASHYWADSAVRVAVIGSGVHAREALIAVASVCRVEGARVYSRSSENRRRYVADLVDQVGFPIEPASTPERATADADLILCATQTQGQIALAASDLGSARYVSSISSTIPSQRELDDAVLREAARLIIDTPDALDESGDLLAAANGGLDTERIELLSDFLRRPVDARDGLTVYKSIGSIEQDLALAVDVWERASAEQHGQVIDPIDLSTAALAATVKDG